MSNNSMFAGYKLSAKSNVESKINKHFYWMADERTTDTAVNPVVGITNIEFKQASEAMAQYGSLASVSVEINGMFWIRDIQIKVGEKEVAYVSMPSRQMKAKEEGAKPTYFDTLRFNKEEDMKTFKNQILRYVLGNEPAEVEQPTPRATGRRNNSNKDKKPSADMVGTDALGGN